MFWALGQARQYEHRPVAGTPQHVVAPCAAHLLAWPHRMVSSYYDDQCISERTRCVTDVSHSLASLCCHKLHNDAMAAITIRDVPDETRDELAARATLSGRSLQEYLHAQLIELAAQARPRGTVSQGRERKRRTQSTLSVGSILGHRDADRR